MILKKKRVFGPKDPRHPQEGEIIKINPSKQVAPWLLDVAVERDPRRDDEK